MPPPTFGLIEDECGLNAAAAREVSCELALNFSLSPSPRAQTDSWEFATPLQQYAPPSRSPPQKQHSSPLQTQNSPSWLPQLTLDTVSAAEQCVHVRPRVHFRTLRPEAPHHSLVVDYLARAARRQQ
ncbi:hypothetical protein K438DRAFT_1995089 [Mycena galopus ATCC 62051]|nr:hypothetical protein K438DRAFT_1995089 [Mycena galopus ATCC 62051]